MSEQMWVGVLYVLLGFVLVALSFPLLAGRVKRNRWYGFRISKSYESEESWLLINRYGAHQMLRWGSVIAGLGAFLVIAQDLDESYYHWIAIGAPCLLAIPIGQTLWYAKHLP